MWYTPQENRTKNIDDSEVSTPTLIIVYRFSDSVLLLSNPDFTESKSHIPPLTIRVFKATERRQGCAASHADL